MHIVIIVIYIMHMTEQTSKMAVNHYDLNYNVIIQACMHGYNLHGHLANLTCTYVYGKNLMRLYSDSYNSKTLELVEN